MHSTRNKYISTTLEVYVAEIDMNRKHSKIVFSKIKHLMRTLISNEDFILRRITKEINNERRK